MRSIHLARLDKTRPVVVLTRERIRPYLRHVTVAPITTTVRGLPVEVIVGPENGLDHKSVVNCDRIVTIEVSELGRQIGELLTDQEEALSQAIGTAFDLV